MSRLSDTSVRRISASPILRLGLSTSLAAAMLLALGLLLAPPAQAATLTVCAGGGCTYTTIQDAVDAANNGDTVSIGAGTYTLGATILVTNSIDIVGADAASTFVSGANTYRVFQLTGSNQTVSISNLTIQNGNSAGDLGAGILQNNNTNVLAISNVNFNNNTANGGGGGIYSVGALTLDSVNFNSNVANNSNGGAIYSTGTLTLTNVNFNTNISGFNSNGGAIYASGGRITINGGAFTSNQASNGGV